MNLQLRFAAAMLAAGGLFLSGYAAGQNKFGAPKTILHVVTIKWKPGTSETDQQKALQGVKDMAGRIPGIKNIWVKVERLQPRDFNAAFAIEFADRPAADRYAEDPAHAAWDTFYLSVRQQSLSVQLTN